MCIIKLGGDSRHGLKLSPEKIRNIAVFLLDDIRRFSKTEEVKKVASMGDEGSESKNSFTITNSEERSK